jgi:predicted dehydrogenase
MKKLRTAILGCGGFAHTHAKNLVALPEEIELVAFCDILASSAAEFSKQYSGGQAAVFTDHHDLFVKSHLNLAVICLPPYAHSDEVEVAAQHGDRLLMEKPIALSSEHAWRMVTAVEKAEIKTLVGFMNRFGAAVERLKALLTSGESGPVGLMRARYFCNALP